MKPCAESVAAFLSFRFTHLAEVLEVSFVAGLLEDSPGLFRQLVRNAVEVELAILGAFEGLVACADVSAPVLSGRTAPFHTFHLAVLADIRRSLRALGRGMAFLFADTARALENTRLGAFDLGVPATSLGQETKCIIHRATDPSSPQLKQAIALGGSGQSALL